jgi:hypothetical protein
MLEDVGFKNVEATHSSSPGQDWVDAWGFKK